MSMRVNTRNRTRPTFGERRALCCGQSGHGCPTSILMRPRLVRAVSTRASAIYTDPATAHVPARTSTPSLTHRQRAVLDSALRVDHAGEIAANYIYKGQMAVLGRDPTVGPLIQVRVASPLAVHLDTLCAGNVEPGKTTPPRHGQTPSTAPGAAHTTLRRGQGCRLRPRRRHRTLGQRGCHGLHRSRRNGHWRTLRRVCLPAHPLPR